MAEALLCALVEPRGLPHPAGSCIDESKARSNPDDAWKTLELVNDWIKHAETKSGAILTATGVVAAVLYNIVSGQKMNASLLACVVLCSVCVLASGIGSAIALWPRLRSKEPPTSGLYFDHIARSHADQSTYYETLKLLTSDSTHLIREIAAQVWSNAHVAHRKFKWASRAMACLLAAIAFLGGVVLIIALQ